MLSEILYAIRADFCCIAILLVLYFQSLRALGKTPNGRFIRKIVIISAIYIVSYAFEELVMGGLIGCNRWLNTIIIITIQFTQSMLCYGWLFYTEFIQKSKLVDQRWKRILLFLPVALFSIALLISIKTNWIYIIHEDGTYARGPGSWTQYVVIALYLLTATIRTFLKSLDKNNYAIRTRLRTHAGFIIAPVVCMIYQFFSPHTFMTGIGITVSILVLYISLQYEAVSVDELTQINNRQQMLRFLSRQISNETENLYLLILDANKFKMINDTYGHVEGDKALVRIAEGLRTIAAQYHCFISRYGGDEFVLICEADSDQMMTVLSKDIQKEIRIVNERACAPYPLGVSIGWAKYPDQPTTIPDFIQLADQQLYLAKQEYKSK